MTPFNYQGFYHWLQQLGLEQHQTHIELAIAAGLDPQRHGDLGKWLSAYEVIKTLPTANTIHLDSQVQIGDSNQLTESQQQQLFDALQRMIPWRKGPFNLFGIHIDTEWRSDWKWDRLRPHISSLKDRNILDIGCGNGYHMWRMLGQAAQCVVGIDPSPRFVVQFEMLKHLAGDSWRDCAHLLPIGVEHLPEKMECFDSVFSMGVLYHRRSPIDHLLQIRDTLLPGGEMILETLVLQGDEGQLLVPSDRYAMMRNVWFIPSSAELARWVERVGFQRVRVVDESVTSTDEQRSTDWMKFHSLPQFLDAQDPSKTVEGYPAPRRAIIVAEKPH